MASPLDRKAGFIEWLHTGVQSYDPNHLDPKKQYAFLDAGINFADTANVMQNGAWHFDAGQKIEQAPLRKNVRNVLKYVDLLVIQLLTGTLIFGFLQAAAERFRAISSKNIDDANEAGLSQFFPWVFWNLMSVVSAIMAVTARAGLFVTQIFAAAVRFPLAIISGTVGLIWGIVTPTPKDTNRLTDQPLTKGSHIYACVIDFISPFAPMAAKSAVVYMAELNRISTGSALGPRPGITEGVRATNRTVAIYALSLLLAITLITLLSVGTFGVGGLAAMPFMNTLVSGIALVFNNMFGFAGLHIAGSALGAGGGLTSFPVLSGFASFFGFSSGIGAKVLIGTMLTGALTSLFGQVFRAASEVPASLAKEIPGSTGSSPALKNGKTANQDNNSSSDNPYAIYNKNIAKQPIVIGIVNNDNTNTNTNTNTNDNDNDNDSDSDSDSDSDNTTNPDHLLDIDANDDPIDNNNVDNNTDNHSHDSLNDKDKHDEYYDQDNMSRRSSNSSTSSQYTVLKNADIKTNNDTNNKTNNDNKNKIK